MKLASILLITLTLTISLQLTISEVSNSDKSKNTKEKKTNLRTNNKSNSKSKQVTLVTDRSGFGTELGTVIRRSPSVFVGNNFGHALVPPPQKDTWFMNSNTSNGPNVGSLGHSPEIVNNRIIMHDRSPVTVVKETPAHLGYRNEKKTITSMNKTNGRVESHDIHEKIPIYGNVESIRTVQQDNVKAYDMDFRRMQKGYTKIQENPEFNFDATPNKYLHNFH